MDGDRHPALAEGTAKEQPWPASALPLKPFTSPGEHVALLAVPLDEKSARCQSVQRKEDFLAPGVAALFGVIQGQAELLAVCFEASRFSADAAAGWLDSRGMAPASQFIPAAAAPDGTPGRGRRGPLRVLVVEDYPDAA